MKPRNEADADDRHDDEAEGPLEIAIVGDLIDNATQIYDKLLETPAGGECTVYFDSPGGSVYAAISIMTLISIREMDVTGIVTGECSSAALWPLAACRRRIVTPYSVLKFHPGKWESEANVGVAEAAEWARHFGFLETEMDDLLAQFFGLSRERLDAWMKPGRFVTGREFAQAGLAELVELKPPAKKPS